MSLGRHLKVFQIKGPSISILLEHRNNKESLWVEDRYSILLDSPDAIELKGNSTKIADAYGCLGAIKLSRGYDNYGFYLLLLTGCRNVGRVLDSEIYRITDVSFVSIKDASVETNSAASDMKRLLCSGSFYFSSSNADESKNTIEITHSLQSKKDDDQRSEFLWNRNLLAYFSFRGIPCKSWFIDVICGGVDIRTIYVGAQQARAALINRLSCDRVGTRYNVRGVNDSGNVANFVESEQIICIGDNYTSFLQTRGSVPLYWEQPGLNVGSHKVKMPFGFDLCFQAFERHFEMMHNDYSSCVLVNLLGSKEGETYLSNAYQRHHEASRFSKSMPLVNFDYHSECRQGKASNISKLMDQLNPHLDTFGVLEVVDDNRNEQSGVLRVNCLDCLDRTNSVQSYVGLQMAAKQLKALGHVDNNQLLTRFTEAFKSVWQQTGDLVSRMYAGTGALEGKDKVGKLKDGARSVSRAIQNNFLDQGKQETMDSLLRIPFHDPDLHHLSRAMLAKRQFLNSSSDLLVKMFERHHDYSDDVLLRVCVGTWNVNGGKFFRSIAYKDKTLKDWLISDESPSEPKTYYQAIYDYSSSEENDLSFAQNELILVDYELEGGEWLHGFKGEGEEGIFPSPYVQKLSNPHLVVHDFPAQQDGDLDLWTNEIVDVIDTKGDWLTGRTNRDGENHEGMFPANFVTKIDTDDDANAPVDIFAIGFEEMVELNAGNIVNTSQTNQKEWATELQKTISEKQEYVLLTSEQLVGVCLFVFVRKEMADHVREVSVSMIKTGMGGAAGNKGAVAISFLLYNSSLCFVCSHFAAGQTQVQERNNDFAEISTKLGFVKGRSLFCHDYVFWCGDFNYRIDLTGDDVKKLVKSETWEKLREFDQLLVQKKMGNVFKGFIEGEINFAPTYKYDPFSDDYDTSEKCRVPAWTDRILWKRKKWLHENNLDTASDDAVSQFDCGTLHHYNRAELKTSDHRPVVAVIDVRVRRVNEQKREDMHSELAERYQPINSPVFIYVEGKQTDEDLCRRFIETFEVGRSIHTCCFRNSFLVVYPEAWMSLEALNFDGSVFEGRRMRVSEADNNTPDEPITMNTVSQAISEESHLTNSVDSELENIQMTNHLTLPSSHSSDDIVSMHAQPLARPRSTPLLTGTPHRDSPPMKSRTPKKAPPRPPSISKPNPASDPAKNAPVSLMAPLQPVVLENVGVQLPPTQPITDMDSWNIPAEPPKIKPRKTVPKRRAPAPPKKPPQPMNVSGKAPPLPASPPVHHPLTGSLLDDDLSSLVKPSMLPPLIPLQNTMIYEPLVPSKMPPPLLPPSAPGMSKPLVPSAASNMSKPSAAPTLSYQPLVPSAAPMMSPVLGPSDGPNMFPPLVPSEAPNMPRPLVPSQTTPMYEPLIPTPITNNASQNNPAFQSTADPWSMASSQSTDSQVSKSFTTDFSDFTFP